MIKDGMNGEVLELGSAPSDYATILLRYWEAPIAYIKMVERTRERFREHSAGTSGSA